MLNLLKKIIPKSIFEFFQPAYHLIMAFLGALIYGFPSREIVIIGVTGTKGKTTVVEIVNSILEAAGYKTAISSTLHFKIGEKYIRNLFKMTMPGRLFMQKFLRQAVDSKCDYAVVEMTSEGAKQFRHKFIYLDALIFTNLAPEHIESHGSYQKYLEAKLSIAKTLEKTPKKNPAIIVNIDDKEAPKFLDLNIENKITYSLNDPVETKTDENGSSFQIEKVVVHSKLPGIFNVSNMLGAIACARHFEIPLEVIKKGIENIDFVRGRMEKIDAGQKFDVVVDYAHTPDSLKAVYEAYKGYKRICVLGNTGGGRDKWKRTEMAHIADKYCHQIILTNEDPYDEDPKKIIEEMKKAITKKPCEIVMDRRKAIGLALKKASDLRQDQISSNKNVAVLITGKGTDPYIMGPNNTKIPWDDAGVAREEVNRIMNPIQPSHPGRQEL